ncbi:MAG TPA: L-histidine N(alpha)-methyltransferase [Daejeonella sp.]|nr:L-histidine N(alpha)-methyltransferase [Daejeonella sp.]
MDNNTTLLMKDTASEITGRDIFLRDVLKGLSTSPKYLESKYFYDQAGDSIFQQIMHSPEYYPTNCELEILSTQTSAILDPILEKHPSFDLVELGAGDALKSKYLLEYLAHNAVDFSYFPIDISDNVIANLTDRLPKEIPNLVITGLQGDYFNMLEKANSLSDKPKLVLFLGSNIGNMFPEDALNFCDKLKSHLKPGDLLLIGFDLKKDPQTILNAYNDSQGFTRNFNLNLLTRINRELAGDFDLNAFTHFPTYNPQTGSCQSYLVSRKHQEVVIDNHRINFEEHECIHMEISQKYTIEQADALASATGFSPVQYYYDSKRWFLDVIWQC